MDRRFKMCTSILLLPINFVQKYWMNNDIYVVHIEFIHTFMHNVSVLFVHGIFFVFIYYFEGLDIINVYKVGD